MNWKIAAIKAARRTQVLFTSAGDFDIMDFNINSAQEMNEMK